jgi:hypothetical protein
MSLHFYVTGEAYEIDKSELTLGKELWSGQFWVRYKFMFLYCTYM